VEVDGESARGKRPWANINRRVTRITPTSATAASESANTKIGELADTQKDYYKSKLAFKEQQHQLIVQEHNKKMLVLDLQQQYYAAMLCKLTPDE